LSTGFAVNWGRSLPPALVFTAGIGEHAPEIRRRVCKQAAWLDVELDDAANAAGAANIATAGSKISAWVIPTNEDLMIARHSWRLTHECAGVQADGNGNCDVRARS
jgi:acetate kinase